MIYLRKSKIAFIVSLTFLLLAGAAFVTHIHSVKTNPADSGESGIVFFLFTLPWGMLIPQGLTYSRAWALLAYPVSWLMVLLNSFLLYCVFGGVRFKKK